MEEKNKKRITLFAKFATVAVAAIGFCTYKHKSLGSAISKLSGMVKKSSFKPKYILSEEVPVSKEIVDSLTSAAEEISDIVKKATGEQIDATVVSNMFSHPDSGSLIIELGNLTKKGADMVLNAASKVMGTKGEIINGKLYFD